MTDDVVLADPESQTAPPDIQYPDIHFTPGYGAAAATAENGTWQWASLGDALLVPWVLQAVSHVGPRLATTELGGRA
jgi:hypothetical protein